MSGLLIRLRPSIRAIRSFKTSSRLRDGKPEPSTPGSKPQGASDSTFRTDIHHLTNFEKKILVFAKKYPSVKDVPDTISSEVMGNCMSKARIRMANYMMLVTAVGCLITIMIGHTNKKDRMEEMQVQHDEFRRQITAEYTASVKRDADKK